MILAPAPAPAPALEAASALALMPGAAPACSPALTLALGAAPACSPALPAFAAVDSARAGGEEGRLEAEGGADFVSVARSPCTREVREGEEEGGGGREDIEVKIEGRGIEGRGERGEGRVSRGEGRGERGEGRGEGGEGRRKRGEREERGERRRGREGELYHNLFDLSYSQPVALAQLLCELLAILQRHPPRNHIVCCTKN